MTTEEQFSESIECCGNVKIISQQVFEGMWRWLQASQVAQWQRHHLPMKETWVHLPWEGKVPWRRKWQPTPVVLPEESQGQRSLAGCSPWYQEEVGHDLATKPPPQQRMHMESEPLFWGNTPGQVWLPGWALRDLVTFYDLRMLALRIQPPSTKLKLWYRMGTATWREILESERAFWMFRPQWMLPRVDELPTWAQANL